MSDAADNEPEFQRLQRQFAAHLRNPHQEAAPDGIEDRRLAIYRDLVFNNVVGFLDKGFPVLRAVYGEAGWHRLARAFLHQHVCVSPYFLNIPEEFVRFLAEVYQPEERDPPFLLELAHYEWIELVLDTASSPEPEAVQADGDLMRGIPCLSPLHQVLSYRYPVHHIGPDYQPREPAGEAVWLLVYRDRDQAVAFMEINAVTARLLTLMAERPGDNGEALINTLALELGHPDTATLAGFAAQLLEQLRQRGLILGTRLMTV